MSDPPKTTLYPSLERLADRVRDDFKSGGCDFVFIYAHNGVGKTRLSMAFKDAGKRKNDGRADTLYFNAFTEDLFVWNNDLDGDADRYLELNPNSRFFDGLQEFEMDNRIRRRLEPIADFRFELKLEYAEPTPEEKKPRLKSGRVIFERDVRVGHGDDARSEAVEGIKVSRGEENQFIWCFFLAILEIALDPALDAYGDIQYVYIDDPISSLDDNNAIAVAVDLAALLRDGKDRMKVVVSSHHALFFNVACKELESRKSEGRKTNRYLIHRPRGGEGYELRKTDEQPFFHHVAMLSEMQHAAETGQLNTYHFNEMRGVLERTARFFGYEHFSKCLESMEDARRYERAVQLLSHRTFSLFDPVPMGEDTRRLFREVLDAFRAKYDFDLPEFTYPEPADPKATTPETPPDQA